MRLVAHIAILLVAFAGCGDSQSSPAPTSRAPGVVTVQPERPRAPAPTTAPAAVTVYITDTGTMYHRSGCRYLHSSRRAVTLDSARRAYSPCSVCKP